MKWPTWIPYPGQWLRALVMMVATIPIILLTKILGSWVMLNVINDAHPVSIALLICWFFFSLIGLTAWGHHKLFGPDDRKRITPQSWWAGTFAVVCCVVLFYIYLVMAVHHGNPRYIASEGESMFVFTLLAYLCQGDYLIRQRMAKKKAAQPPSKALR